MMNYILSIKLISFYTLKKVFNIHVNVSLISKSLYTDDDASYF